jgi:hypothetical protein
MCRRVRLADACTVVSTVTACTLYIKAYHKGDRVKPLATSWDRRRHPYRDPECQQESVKMLAGRGTRLPGKLHVDHYVPHLG